MRCVCLASGCPAGWFGADCASFCNCSNGGVCDSATGNCTCALGWTGEHCDTGERGDSCMRSAVRSRLDKKAWGWIMCSLSECPAGRFGADCALKCNCQNNGSCDRVTGTCRCGPGYYGGLCEHGEGWSHVTNVRGRKTMIKNNNGEWRPLWFRGNRMFLWSVLCDTGCWTQSISESVQLWTCVLWSWWMWTTSCSWKYFAVSPDIMYAMHPFCINNIKKVVTLLKPFRSTEIIHSMFDSFKCFLLKLSTCFK